MDEEAWRTNSNTKQSTRTDDDDFSINGGEVSEIRNQPTVLIEVDEENERPLFVSHKLREQIFTLPTLLLVCPLLSLATIFMFLDHEENWNWRAAMTEHHIRKYVYGYQGLGFSFLLASFLVFGGADRMIFEAWGVAIDHDAGDGYSVGMKLFQRQLAFLIAAVGLGLFMVEDTLRPEASAFASAFGSWMIFTGTIHYNVGLPFMLYVPFLWNGTQLILIAWLGGNLVDGEWTSDWKGDGAL